MSILDVGQDMAQTLHAVDVLADVRERLEGSGWALYVFHRLSSAELEVLVWQETHDECPQGCSPVSVQGADGTVAA